MDTLKQKFFEKATALRGEIKTILSNHGEEKVDEVTLSQVYGGARGIISMIWEPSLLDPIEGIRFRGYSIPELREKLPKAPKGSEPLPEGIFYLMLTGEIPTYDDVLNISNNWARRSIVPKHVFDILEKLPANTHPMTQFCIAISALQTESLFAAAYKLKSILAVCIRPPINKEFSLVLFLSKRAS